MSAIVHWDLENVPIPSGISAASVVGRLREALHTQVRVITDMFVYADAGKVPVQVRNELSSLGFDCIDCSHAAGKTGQVDIRIVARALKPGLSGEQRPSTVLVTGDGDFAYTLSTLRNAGVGTILVYNSEIRRGLVPRCV